MDNIIEQIESKIKDIEILLDTLKESLRKRETERSETKEEKTNDKYKLPDFLDYLKEFGLEDKFNRCKTEDERYDIYALYTRVRLSKVHTSEYFKQKSDIDEGVFSAKPNNKDNATFIRRKPKKKEEPREESKEKPRTAKIIIGGLNQLYPYEQAIIQEAIKKLPKSVIDYYVKEQYKTKMVPSAELEDKWAGICDYNKKIIKLAIRDINSDYINTNKGYDDTLLHELGHMIDYKNHQYASNTTQFIDIYRREKTQLYRNSIYEYVTKDPKEYFAQSFSVYILDPYRLRREAPRTYDFIANYVKTI